MANSSFGDAFSRSFDSVVASLRRERESELADRRLRERMKEERGEARGEALLKELGATGADVSSFRRQGGGYYTEAAEMELAEAQRQALAGKTAAMQYRLGGSSEVAVPPPDSGLSGPAWHKGFQDSLLGIQSDDLRINQQTGQEISKEQRSEDKFIKDTKDAVGSRLLTTDAAAFPVGFHNLKPVQQLSTLDRIESNSKERRKITAEALLYGAPPPSGDALSPVSAADIAAIGKAKSAYDLKEQGLVSFRQAAVMRLKDNGDLLHKYKQYVPSYFLNKLSNLDHTSPEYADALHGIALRLHVSQEANTDEATKSEYPLVEKVRFLMDVQDPADKPKPKGNGTDTAGLPPPTLSKESEIQRNAEKIATDRLVAQLGAERAGIVSDIIGRINLTEGKGAEYAEKLSLERQNSLREQLAAERARVSLIERPFNDERYGAFQQAVRVSPFLHKDDYSRLTALMRKASPKSPLELSRSSAQAAEKSIEIRKIMEELRLQEDLYNRLKGIKR